MAVGRVTELDRVWRRCSFDRRAQSSAAAYLSSATLEGLIQGQGTGRLSLNYLDAEAVVAAGDQVVTSPASATFPPEIPIGTVAKAHQRHPFLAFQSVEVIPILSPSRIREVMILKGGSAP